jgi:hypothetical protein
MLWLQNEHEPNHALQVMFLKDLPLRRCPGEYWDLPVCLVRVGHSNQRKREVDEEAVSHLSSLHGSIRRFRHEGGLPFSGSIAGSVCTRTQGVWISDQARHLFDYTKSIGGKIAATEFMNEPTYATMGGAPKGYDTMPQAMAATLWCSAPSFETLHAIHYFLVRVQLVRDRSRCQWVAACSNPKTCYMRPATYSMFFLTISMRLLRSGAQTWGHHHKQPRQRHSLKTGSRARRRLAHFTPTFETGLSQANHFGLRKLPMQPAVETPGRPLFWAPSDILFNMQASRSVA